MGSLKNALLVATLVLASACGASRTTSVTPSAPALRATVVPRNGACGAPTPAATEGPFYKAGPPERKTLVEPGMPGTRLILEGVVRDTSCTPVRDAKVDFWQADSKGVYDNQGYRLRGYQLTTEQGNYHLETVVPGEYPGRTPHIHVKITPPGGATLTTQLYMPGVASNQSDSIFTPATVMNVKDISGNKMATFDFVIAR